MFDEQSKLNSNSAGVTSRNLPPRPEPGVSSAPGAEDIFAGAETVPAPRPAKPAVFQPRPPAASNPAAFNPQIFPERVSILENKFVSMGLSVAIIIVVGLMIWFGYKFIVNNGKVSDFNANINSVLPINSNAPAGGNVNTNTTNQPAPGDIDTDKDGLSDEEERSLGTNLKNPDTDSDGLIDRAEVKIYKTDPKNPDTDGDGFSDGNEVINGFDPNRGGGARLFDVPKK